MIRAGLSLILAAVFFLLESVIVMKLFHYENGIVFPNGMQVLMVYVMNVMIAFAMLTQLTPWFMRISRLQAEEE